MVGWLKKFAVGSGPDGSTTGTGSRQTWANQLANQSAQPLSILRPTSLNVGAGSVVSILAQALTAKCAVKAAGSGHSYSDVATTPDFFIDTHGLSQVASTAAPITGQLTPAMLRAPALPLSLGGPVWPFGSSPDLSADRALIEMEAGITIHDLNPQLDARNLGLTNMGGYDGQTIVGAISTSTHGSGIGLGPFPDMVRSLVLATTGAWSGKTVGGGGPVDGVYLYRIEPTGGITNPATYTDPSIALIQDDDCFNATICSMGCFGVIYSVVIEVMPAYRLTETRTFQSLSEVLSQLRPDPENPGWLPDVLLRTRNYEVLIQPYPMLLSPSDYLCLVTARNFAPAGAATSQNRTTIPDWTAQLLVILLDAEPELTPEAIDISLCTLVEKPDAPYVQQSYNVYNLGLEGGVGFAAEIGFSLVDGNGHYTPASFHAAIDKIHAIAATARTQGQQYQTSAFSLRFVKGSRALLSMMEGKDTAMIEMDMSTGTYAGPEIMYRYETAMYSLGGRPHWGLEFNYLTGSNGLVGKMYPKLGAWMAVYRQLNALGTFNNSFTQRMGFTVLE